MNLCVFEGPLPESQTLIALTACYSTSKGNNVFSFLNAFVFLVSVLPSPSPLLSLISHIFIASSISAFPLLNFHPICCVSSLFFFSHICCVLPPFSNFSPWLISLPSDSASHAASLSTASSFPFHFLCSARFSLNDASEEQRVTLHLYSMSSHRPISLWVSTGIFLPVSLWKVAIQRLYVKEAAEPVKPLIY